MNKPTPEPLAPWREEEPLDVVPERTGSHADRKCIAAAVYGLLEHGFLGDLLAFEAAPHGEPGRPSRSCLLVLHSFNDK